MRPHRRQPTRLPRPWDSPGKNTGVGCHSLLQCMKVKSLSPVRLLATPWTAAHQAPPSMGFSRQEYWSGVAQPYPTLCDPMDRRPPGSPVYRILQARILKWVVMPSSRGSSQPRNPTRISFISCIGRRVLYPLSHLGSPSQLAPRDIYGADNCHVVILLTVLK